MDTKSLKQLSFDTCTPYTLLLLREALDLILKRYPALKSMSSEGSISYLGIMAPKQEWLNYASCNETYWRLAGDAELAVDIAQAYLHLLKPKPGINILDIKSLDNSNLGLPRDTQGTTIMPFKSGEYWTFAVIYSDCVHWYDSRPNPKTPTFHGNDSKRVTNLWKGPVYSKEEDSGIFMLMGIASISQGGTHLDQDSANAAIIPFRSQVVIELSCGETNPSESRFQYIRSLQAETNSQYFDDALFGMEASSSPVPDLSPLGNSITPTVVARHSNTTFPTDSNVLGAQSIGDFINLPREEDARAILYNLCEAVGASRLYTGNYRNKLEYLWNLLENNTSSFHERYISVLFYEAMDQIRDDDEIQLQTGCFNVQHVKKRKAACKIWKDLCELRGDWGNKKYSLLLIPHRRKPDAAYIRRLKDRLNDETDPLTSYIQEAQPLCEAILQNTLPQEILTIDHYTKKQKEPLNKEIYSSFMKLSRSQIAIPRM